MERFLQVARREFLETARNKWFVIGTVALPLLLALMMLMPAFLMRAGGGRTRCAVVDETGSLVEPLRRALAADARMKDFDLIPAPEGAGVERLREAVSREEYDALMHLPAGILEAAPATFYARGLSLATERLDNVVTEVVTRHRLSLAGIESAKAEALTRWVPVESFQIGKSGAVEKKDWGMVYIASFMFVFFIYFTVAIYGVTIMNSTVQEKSSRVMEVLLSSLTPFELLAGKIAGKGAAGLTQVGAWALAGLTFVLFGSGVGAPGGADLSGLIAPHAFGWFIVFFVIAFFTMASIYAALGSTCNTPEEATQLQFPAVMPMLMAMLLSFLITSRPDHPAGTILSFVPYLSPILMFVRILVRTPPLWQILLAIVINLATIVATAWLAARIYRIGVLMYGKRPTLPEIIRWVRAA